MKLIAVSVGLCAYATTAFAYLDPGTGSLLISSAIALVASSVFLAKSIFYKIVQIGGGGGSSLRSRNKRENGLVFYSEGKQYHSVFLPIVEFLDSISYPYTYLTSSQEDYDLHCARFRTSVPNPNTTYAYIGASDSNTAIARLNSLQAHIVVMTTPQLDVLQIKRSRNVKHYCHIIHSLPHVDIYEIFALDYFDSVFTNSPIHTQFIREVERVRKLPTKQITITGCTYLDVLERSLRHLRESGVDFLRELGVPKDKKVVLIAPSWGREALLSKYGFSLIEPFINSSFFLIIRPHPQSYLTESAMLNALQKRTKEYNNIIWDNRRDNIYALSCADVMIGDFSGVLFDFACLFEKPVLTPVFHFRTIGYDLEDIYQTPWVKGALSRIGRSFDIDEFSQLPSIVESMLSLDNTELTQSIRKMKQELWHFQGKSGKKTALELLQIECRILESSLQDMLPIHKQIQSLDTLISHHSNLYDTQCDKE